MKFTAYLFECLNSLLNIPADLDEWEGRKHHRTIEAIDCAERIRRSALWGLESHSSAGAAISEKEGLVCREAAQATVPLS